ncbi:hypothetical protein EVG20_g1601 [Dentipellis fragilis]|uniref:Uncharacterized protein n=1 Tax=Dentipellis fragilis TaxID=205917 RepID=A0A4Y9ZBN5_9AGAM|nr:hypothetical protein EVG20_g1601 [Dentipellis fragilis]
MGGWDTNVLMDVIKNLPPDPHTGDLEPRNMTRYLQDNAHRPEIQRLLQNCISMNQNIRSKDISSFDFSSLNVGPEIVWIIDIVYAGKLDRAGIERDPDDPNLLPSFQLTCSNVDNRLNNRLFEMFFGNLPTSDQVLQFIKRAIAAPIPPFRPALPTAFHLRRRLEPHMSVLRPFLDSLPAPFAYQLETPEMEEVLTSAAAQGRDEAFARRDRAAAIKAYSAAIQYLDDVLDNTSGNPDVEQRLERLVAVVCANRAAAYLLEGEGRDAEMALIDGRVAEDRDPTYIKGYYRETRALEILGELKLAQECIERGLARPEFRDNEGFREELARLRRLQPNPPETTMWRNVHRSRNVG